MKLKKILFLFFYFSIFSQNINLNDDYSYSLLRNSILLNEIETNFSFNVRPIESNFFSEIFKNQYKSILKNKSGTLELKTLGIDFFTEYNSHHPYNRNNGSMIPNRGYQHIISPGLYFKAGPLTIQLKPEQHYSQNKEFDGFWEGHYDYNWWERYNLWNHIDMPERFGKKKDIIKYYWDNQVSG